MKKNLNRITLFLLLTVFIMIFKYNDIVKEAVLSSMDLWLKSLVPFMLPMYVITDLLLNYGLGNILFKIFHKNYPFLIMISLFMGTPTNAKYIRDFYDSGYIDLETSNWLLLFSYSPNPLFIIGIAPTFLIALKLLGYLYISNALIALFSKRFFNISNSKPKLFSKQNFSKCLENSINKSFNILILILGIICVYAVIIRFIDLIIPNCIFLKTILEMTNALAIIKNSSLSIFPWMMLAISFGGLSIHTQIKSILEDTPINYKYFLIGRLIASIVPLILIFN